MENNPLVSIITPCFNGEKYLRSFLDSIVSQDYYPIEFIFVDDGSTDKTKDILFEYKGRFQEKSISFKYFYQKNKGAAAAINTGLKSFTGKFVMWVDSDDILLKDNVSTKVQYLEKHVDCGFVISQGSVVQFPDLVTVIGYLKREKPKDLDNLFSDLIYEKNVVFGPGVIMVRAEALYKSIPRGEIFESEQGQNWQLMLPIAYNYKCGYIEKSLFKCVSHSDSHSRKQRTYKELIKRQKDFECLLLETINRIDQMPKAEKEVWNNRIIVKHGKNILRLAKEKKDFILYFEMKRRIRIHGGNVVKQDLMFYDYWQSFLLKLRKTAPWKFARRIKRKIMKNDL